MKIKLYRKPDGSVTTEETRTEMVDIEKGFSDLQNEFIGEVDIELPEKKKWEPKGGEWYIGADGDVANYSSSWSSRLFGTEYDTKEQAEKARDATRRFNMLLQLKREYCQDYEPNYLDDDSEKYSIGYDCMCNKWIYTNELNIDFLLVCFPKEVAEKIVERLNNGEIVL